LQTFIDAAPLAREKMLERHAGAVAVIIGCAPQQDAPAALNCTSSRSVGRSQARRQPARAGVRTLDGELTRRLSTQRSDTQLNYQPARLNCLSDQVLPGSQALGGDVIFDKIQALAPRNDAQHTIKSQAESMTINLAQMRWLLFEQSGTSISAPLLVVVVFWLSILFMIFGLLAPRNVTVVIILLLSAISVAGAIFLIVELFAAARDDEAW